MNDLNEIFKTKAMKVQRLWDSTDNISDIEPHLLDILNYTKEKIKYRAELANCYIDIINDYKNGPLEIVVFSMRELQWQEVKTAAIQRKLSSSDPRVWSAMNDILAVYEPKWDDADLYEYYSHETKS